MKLLQRDMLSYDISKHGSLEVVELLRYAFEKTATVDNENDLNELRALVAGFAACKSRELLGCAEFRALVEEGGQIALKIMELMSKESALE